MPPWSSFPCFLEGWTKNKKKMKKKKKKKKKKKEKKKEKKKKKEDEEEQKKKMKKTQKNNKKNKNRSAPNVHQQMCTTRRPFQRLGGVLSNYPNQNQMRQFPRKVQKCNFSRTVFANECPLGALWKSKKEERYNLRYCFAPTSGWNIQDHF